MTAAACNDFEITREFSTLKNVNIPQHIFFLEKCKKKKSGQSK